MTPTDNVVNLQPLGAVQACGGTDLLGLESLLQTLDHDPVEVARGRVAACDHALGRADAALQTLAGGAARLDISAREMALRTTTAIAQVKALQRRQRELRAELQVIERAARR